MSGNGLTVVSLLDDAGNVVGYAAGTAEETALAAAQVYAASDPVTQTAVQFLKEVMAVRVKEVREAAEADGVLINGNLYDTSPEAQVKYLGSLVFATRDPNYSGEWKTINNGYITLDSLGVYTVCSGIMTYLQNCAVWEQDLIQDIAAATTVAQLQAIDFFAGKPVGSAGLPPPAPGTSAPPPLEAGSVNVADVVAETCTISGLTTSGSITTTGNITCGGAFSTASFALASVNTGAVTATSVTAGSGTISTTGATNTGSLAVSGNATVTGTLGAGATTVASLSAGAGSISTTGTIETTGSTNTGSLAVSGNASVAGTLGAGATTVSSLTTAGATSTGTLTITGTQTSGTYLRSNGTSATLSAIQAADVPTLNQNTTGTASNVTATTNSTLTTLSALSLPVGQVSGLPAANLSVTSLTTSGNATVGGAITAGGSVSSTSTDNVFMGVDAAASSRLGFVKKAAANPVVAAGSATDMLFGHFSTANLLGGITSGTFTQRLAIAASTGAVTVANALNAASAAITGALAAGATTVASLVTTGNATVGGTLGVTGVATAGSLSTTGATNTGTMAATGNVTVGGFLGIGVTNPTSQLDLYNPVADSDTSFRLAGAGGGGAMASLLFAPFAARTGGPSAIIRALENNYSCDITFMNADSGSVGATTATERMRINTAGDVGIGTSNPQARLDVNGTMNVSGAATFADVTILDQRLFRIPLGGVLTSANTTVRTAATILYRLGDRPPTAVVAFVSGNIANDFVIVRVFEPARNVVIGAQMGLFTTLAGSAVTVPLTGTQYTPNSDTYYTIQLQFWRSAGLGTATMQAAGFIL